MNPHGDGSNVTPRVQNETGRPIRILLDQERETSPNFIAKVRNRIHRRTATSQAASLSWHLPKTILIEMARVLMHLLRAFGTKKDPYQ